MPLASTLSSQIILLAKQMLSERGSFLADLSLLPGHDDFLVTLLTNDGMSMGVLAEQLNISPSSATKTAIKLEALEMIRREASRIDNRQNHVWLTDKGRKTADMILDGFQALEQKNSTNLKLKDAERLHKIIEKLTAGLYGKAAPGEKEPKKAGKSKKSKKKSK